MAERITVKDILKRIRTFEKDLSAILAGLRVTKREQENIFIRGGTAAEVKTAIDDKLTDLSTKKTDLIAGIADLQFGNKTMQYPTTLKPGLPIGFHHFSIDVDGGGSTAILTFKDVVGGDFTLTEAPFENADKVVVSKSSDSTQNGRYTVQATSDNTQITFTTIMPGSDNTNEQSMVITLRSR